MGARLTKSQRKQLRKEGISTDSILPTTKNHFRLADVEPLTENQGLAFDAFYEGNNLLLHGLSGTGKTFISLYLALDEIFSQQPYYKRIVIIRSVVPTRDIGFLPGSAQEKSKVYEQPYRTVVNNLFSRGDAYDILSHKNVIDFETTSFLRGLTFEDCIVFVDEVNNMNFHELDSIITRAGRNCRLIFSGDFRQSDLRSNSERKGLLSFMEVLDHIKHFKHVEFTEDDIVRSGLVKEYIITKHRLGFTESLYA